MRNLQPEISKELANLNIKHHVPKTSRDRDGNVVDRPCIVVDSWNALKGVEFNAVIIAGVDSLVEITDDLDRNFEAKAGLYTAITRARDHLVMLYENKNETVDLIESALTTTDRLDYVE